MMTTSLRVTFVTEAGSGVGLGHLRRCQALATAFRPRGVAVRFVIAGDVEIAGPGVARLDWTRDPQRARAALAAWRADVVVVDSYRAGAGLLESLHALAACVVAVDDLADRPLPAHLIVNGAYHASRLAYRGRPDTVFLLGPEYALLDPAFGEPPQRSPRDEVRRVLVTFGGDPLVAGADAAVRAARRAAPPAAIDLVLGPGAPAVSGAGERVTVHRGLGSLRSLMLDADLAVTGGGMTLYECLATGTPVVGMCLADNQRPNIDELGGAGLILKGEPSLEVVLGRLAGDPSLRRAMSARGREVVDGRGAARVVDEIQRACVAVGVSPGAR